MAPRPLPKIAVEQFNAANKATVDSLIALANTALASAERIADLNLKTALVTIEDSVACARKLMQAKSPQDAIAIQAGLAQPAMERMAAYSSSLYEITAQTNTELAGLLQEQFSDFQQSASRLFEQAVKTVPIGSDAAYSSVQDAFFAAYKAFGNMYAASKKQNKRPGRKE